MTQKEMFAEQKLTREALFFTFLFSKGGVGFLRFAFLSQFFFCELKVGAAVLKKGERINFLGSAACTGP